MNVMACSVRHPSQNLTVDAAIEIRHRWMTHIVVLCAEIGLGPLQPSSRHSTCFSRGLYGDTTHSSRKYSARCGAAGGTSSPPTSCTLQKTSSSAQLA